MKKYLFIINILCLFGFCALGYSQDNAPSTSETNLGSIVPIVPPNQDQRREIAQNNEYPYFNPPDQSGMAQQQPAVSSGPQASSSTVTASKDNPGVIDVLDLKNIDILDVLKLIAQKSGYNIVAGQNVQGRVTVYLKSVTVEEALTIIVGAYGWAYEKEGEIIRVMTAKDFEDKHGFKFGQDIQTKIHEVLHVSVTDMVAVLSQIKGVNGKVIADEKTHTLILIDQANKIEEMEQVIARMDVPVSTEIYDLSYAKAEEISKKITEVLTPGVGAIRFDERSNKLIVSDTPLKLVKIGKMVEAFDQKDKEVLIEAKIVQIVLNDENKMGVDWEAVVSSAHHLDFLGDFDVINSTDKKGRISIGTIADDDYTFLIEALNSMGKTNLLSSPRITVLNNKEAKILVGSTEPYVTTTTTTPASGPTTTAESVNFIEVGVKLFVTPMIHNDGFITMKIKPEVSSVVRELTTSNNNTIPVVETSEAETTVTIKNGATIVIGGLIKEEKTKTTKKVPVLGDVPVFGYAFRNQNDSSAKTEIAIFLSPKIVTGDSDADKDQDIEPLP